jgi:hypothetical protein
MRSEPYEVVAFPDYQVRILIGVNDLTSNDDNVDVYVEFLTGETYVTTFYSVNNLASLMDKWEKTGEDGMGGGKYFLADKDIIVRSLTVESVCDAIAELHKLGQLKKHLENVSCGGTELMDS